MWMSLSSQFVVVSLVLLAHSCHSEDHIDVVTTTGGLRGRTHVLDGRDYTTFLGVPYAEPPVRNRRFRAPVPKQPWPGMFSAYSYGYSCMQNISDVSRYYPSYVVQIPEPSLRTSEDCLTLNIFSPRRTRDSTGRGLAVMFWIHGGSFETGQGSGYDASALATRGDVVVVTVNYRLNVFGFLCTNDEYAPGNVGLLDQQLALQWVHDNIAAFGGDPSRVTLFGQSAGGASVTAHLTAPGSRPLFKRVIAESGTSGKSRAALKYSGILLVDFAERIAVKAGCLARIGLRLNTREMVNCLTAKSAETVLRAGLDVAAEEILPYVWRLVLDGNFYPEQPSYNTGHDFQQFDVIAGVMSDDGSPLLELVPSILNKEVNQEDGLSEADFDVVMEFLLGPYQYKGVACQAIKFEYSNKSHDYLHQITNVMTDRIFIPGLSSTLRHTYGNARSNRAFVFDHRSTPHVKYPWLHGAPHSEELSYVFGLPFNGSGIGSLFTDDERRLSQRVITYWSNIAKTGDPNNGTEGGATPASSLTYWPEYGTSEKFLLIRLHNSTVGEGYRRDKVEFWTEYLPKLTTTAEESCPVINTDNPSWSSDNPSWSLDAPSAACENVLFGEGFGFTLTTTQAETLVEIFIFLVIALLIVIVLFVGAICGYKYREKVKVGGLSKSNGSVHKQSVFEVNEGFYSESEDTPM